VDARSQPRRVLRPHGRDDALRARLRPLRGQGRAPDAPLRRSDVARGGGGRAGRRNAPRDDPRRSRRVLRRTGGRRRPARHRLPHGVPDHPGRHRDRKQRQRPVRRRHARRYAAAGGDRPGRVHRRPHLLLSRPHRPRPGDDPARAAVHRGGADGRRLPPADPLRAHGTPPDRAARRLLDDHPRDEHHARGVDLAPRCGHPAAHRELGQHARHQLRHAHPARALRRARAQAVDGGLPQRGHPAHAGRGGARRRAVAQSLRSEGQVAVAAYVVRRIAGGVLLLLLLTLVTYVVFFTIPQDPGRFIVTVPHPTTADLKAADHTLGIDRPIYVQYAKYVSRLAHGDLGRSYATQEPVISIVRASLPVTASIVVGGIVLLGAVSLVLGVYCATRPHTAVDRIVATLPLIGIALHPLAVGLLLRWAFAQTLGGG